MRDIEPFPSPRVTGADDAIAVSNISGTLLGFGEQVARTTVFDVAAAGSLDRRRADIGTLTADEFVFV